MNTATFRVDTLHGVNQAPQPPDLVMPNDSDTVITTSIVLKAKKAIDPEGDPLSYDFIIYRDSARGNVVDSVGDMVILGAATEVVWAVAKPVQVGRLYYWSCRAFDGKKHSDWAPHHRFWAVDTTVTIAPPTAAFTVNPTSGYAPLAVQFVDQSTGQPTDWRWDFGDGATAAELNPIHTYQNPGTYTIRLIVGNAGGEDTAWLPDGIALLNAPDTTGAFAISERTVKGTATGTYANTQTADGVCEILTEVESDIHAWKSYSMLDHRWQFNVAPGAWHILHIDGYRPDNADGDNFTFEWSIDDSCFYPLVTINSATQQSYTAAFPGEISGILIIRAIDTDHVRGRRSNDALFVDQLWVETSTSPRPPDTLFIAGIDVSLSGGPANRYWARAVVTIHNQFGSPIEGVTVQGHFTGPTGEVVSGATTSQGKASFVSAKVRNPGSSWSFYVDDVSKTACVYDYQSNIENYDIAKSVNLPQQVELGQNYPNPFNPSTVISFTLPEASDAALVVFNVAGQKVRVLHEGYLEAGRYDFEWDGIDVDGCPAASGIYFYRLRAGEVEDIRKMVLLK
jgi:PKD repeat protein